jgi:hypothetical protein
MKKIAKLTLVLLLIANVAFAQKRISIKKIESRLITNEGVEFVGTLRDKNNDHYMFPRWSNNGVIFVGKKMYGIGNINFNITTNSVDSRITQDKLFMFQSSSVDSISINNHLFKKVGTLLYEVLFERQNSMLLKKYDVSYEAGQVGRMGVVKGPGPTSVVFKYIVVKPGKRMENIELNKRSILEIFENERDILESYAKKEHLSFRKEEDIIKMFRFLSSSSS